MKRLIMGLILLNGLALAAGCGGGGGSRAPLSVPAPVPTPPVSGPGSAPLPADAAALVAARSDALDAATLANAAGPVIAFYSPSYTDDRGITAATLTPLITQYFQQFQVKSISAKHATYVVKPDHVVEEVSMTLVDQQKGAPAPTAWTVAEQDWWYRENGQFVIRWSQAPASAAITSQARRPRRRF